MGDEGTKIFTLRLSGKYAADGVEFSPKTLRYSLLAAEVRSWKDMLEGDEDPIIHLEEGSLMFKFYLSAAVYATLLADIALLNIGNYQITVPSRIKWYNHLVHLAEQKGVESYLLGETGELARITRENAQRVHKKANTQELTRIIQGKIMDLGGEKSSNMHVQTATGKPIIVKISPQQIADLKESIVYKRRNMRVKYRYNPATGEEDDFVFLDFVKSSGFDEESFRKVTDEASVAWADVADHVSWVRQQRGDDTP